MGKTIVEKIIQQHTRDDVRPGKIVWMDIDIRSARDFGGPNVVRHYEREYGEDPVADRAKTFFMFDLCAPACTLKYAENQQLCREFARKQGIRVFDIGRGIGSHVMIEEGLALPGTAVIGTDSHMNILGAVGCFAQGMGDVDVAFAFKTGQTWFEVPETLKIMVRGDLLPPATAKDLTLYLLKYLDTDKAALKAVEFYGETGKNLSLSGRITLCSMVTEMAGIIGFIPEWNDSVLEEMGKLSSRKSRPFEADENAVYSDSLEIDISGLSPQIAVPFQPTNVRDLKDLKGARIDTGFIGSCTNGRTEDLEAAAMILKGKRIKEGVTLKIVPATQRVYGEILEKGILADLFQSGAVVSSPGCGGCAEGHIGLTGAGEVQISTGNRNFAGKQGKGETYLASPAVVAASCVKGCISSPEEL